MSNNKNIKLNLLRRKAEHLLIADKNSIDNIQNIEVKKIFHELQVYQLELEMQNDELQLATQELEDQKTKFFNLFELAPVGYFVTDKSGLIKNVNTAGLKLLNTDKVSLLEKPLLLFIHKEDTDIFYKYFRLLFSTLINQSCQIRLINTKNQLFNVQIEGTVLYSMAEPICYLTITDFTGKQEAELKLKEAKKRLEIALDASLTGIWEIDIVTGRVYMDDFCCSLYGFKLNCFDEKYDTLLKSIYQKDRKNVDFNIRQAMVGEKGFNIRYRVTVSDKIKYIQARAQVITDENDKKRFVGTFTDISEKMVLELEAIRVKEEQQQMILAAGLQAEENEKKRISEFLHNGIAQMLYATKLNIDQAKTSLTAPVFEQLMQLLNQSIKDIRNISFELAPAILTDYGLAATLEDMAMRLTNQQLSVVTHVNNISKALDLQLQLNIFRIVQELVNNSIKHAFASKICVEITKKNRMIYIVVADNGIGFKPDNPTEMPKGIGLSSIKNRLRLYKGTINIEPKLNAGTTINISLKF